MKRLAAFLLIFALTLGLLPATGAAALPESTGETAREMTRLWFGDARERMRLPEAAPAGTDGVMNAYFGGRDQLMRTGRLPAETAQALRDNPEALEAMELWETALEGFRAGAELQILDAQTTVLYDQDHVVFHADGSWSVYAYEWTFFDYDMTSDDLATDDVSGFGLHHKLTLRQEGGRTELVSDEYDAAIPFGLCTMNDSTRAELAAMDYRPELGDETEAVGGAVGAEVNGFSYYSGYDPDACAEYADRYVYHGAMGTQVYESYYNSAYYNYNGIGGDCANYASQCIRAGGMPMVECELYGLEGWCYYSTAHRSGTWTSAYYLTEWMGANRGRRVAANAGSVYKGSPLLYNEAHVTICVGRNSAGVPIIDAHNRDWYHGLWNYWSENVVITTVQLTPTDHSRVVDGLTAFDLDYPAELDQGQDYAIGGLVATDGRLTELAVGVYDEGGRLLTGASLNPDSSQQSLGELAEYVNFRALPAGAYRFRITAADTRERKTLADARLQIRQTGSRIEGPVDCLRTLTLTAKTTKLYWSPQDPKAALELGKGTVLDSDFYLTLPDGTTVYRVLTERGGVQTPLWLPEGKGLTVDIRHTWSKTVWDAVHPHPGQHSCGCGVTESAGETHWMEQCVQCNPPRLIPDTELVEILWPLASRAEVILTAAGQLPERYSVRYDRSDAPFLQCEWDSWRGSYIILYVTAEAMGEGELRVELLDKTQDDRVVYTLHLPVRVAYKTYTICLDDNGGKNGPGTLIKRYGAELILPETVPERRGCRFLGWAEAADAEAPDYMPGDRITRDEDLTLYALWEVVEAPGITADQTKIVLTSGGGEQGRLLVTTTGALPVRCELRCVGENAGYVTWKWGAGDAEQRELNLEARFGGRGGILRLQIVDLDRGTVAAECAVEAEVLENGSNACPGSGFTDMPRLLNWAHEAIDYVLERGLMSGMSTTAFGPGRTVSRAMVVNVLWRIEGSPTGYENPFADVAPGKWYTEAVAWAAATGVVSGVSPERFVPNADITREQLAAILYRFVSARQETGPGAELEDFPDADLVSGWAAEPMAWAAAEGLISGTLRDGQTLLDPKGRATRAQTASILMRLMEKVLTEDNA